MSDGKEPPGDPCAMLSGLLILLVCCAYQTLDFCQQKVRIQRLFQIAISAQAAAIKLFGGAAALSEHDDGDVFGLWVIAQRTADFISVDSRQNQVEHHQINRNASYLFAYLIDRKSTRLNSSHVEISY